jgi:hypothetical protein
VSTAPPEAVCGRCGRGLVCGARDDGSLSWSTNTAGELFCREPADNKMPHWPNRLTHEPRPLWLLEARRAV